MVVVVGGERKGVCVWCVREKRAEMVVVWGGGVWFSLDLVDLLACREGYGSDCQGRRTQAG